MANYSEEIKEWCEAMANAQTKITGAGKNSTGVHSAKYADLQSVMEALKEPFSENGLFVSQPPASVTDNPAYLRLTSRIFHKSGQWQEADMLIKNVADMKLLGASISYARRYMISAQAGLYQRDLDDMETKGKDFDKTIETGDNKIRSKEENKIHDESSEDQENRALAEKTFPRKDQSDVPMGEPPSSNDGDTISDQDELDIKSLIGKLKLNGKKAKDEIVKMGFKTFSHIPATKKEAVMEVLRMLASQMEGDE